jgi:uncharacterized protein (TIGR02246 family)
MSLMMVGALLAVVGTSAAQNKPTGAEAEVRAAMEQALQALRQGDAARLLEMYTPDAQLTMAGRTAVGRDAVRAQIASALAAGLKDIRLEDTEVFAGEGIAVETGRASFLKADGTRLGTSRYMTLWKKTDGRWQILRDFGVPEAAASGSQSAQQQAPAFATKQVEAYTALVLPMTGSYNQIGDAIGRVAAEIGGPPAGPPFGIFNNAPGSVPESELSWEVGFPVPAGTTAKPPFSVRKFPAETVAFAVIEAPYEAERPWQQFIEWVNGQGYQIMGSAMEIWMEGPKTEMRIPVSKPGSN